ncbi:hypothetical protein [Microbacterium sp. NPDC077057]|uniref:hypothetical protein n=1 Tax=unclassified Microbacterium TaxID=2609290 RepID=UPI003441B3FA
MNEQSESPAALSAGHRKRNLIIAAVAVVVLVAAGITTGVVVADANARAEAQAAADAQAEAERVQAEQDHADALEEAQTALEAGEFRYVESEPYGDAAKREELRTEIDALTKLLDSSEPTTEELKDAATSVDIAILLVGSKEQRDAELAAAAEKALDNQYETMAASFEGNGMSPPFDGREYCEYLHEYYTPDNVYPMLWGDQTESRQIDIAAVRVYCPEFAPKMDMVLGGFYDGDHIVGQTIQPGTYRTATGVKDCYWERNDGSGDILDNNFVGAAHNGVTVTVNSGEGFTTNGCGLWIPAG